MTPNNDAPDAALAGLRVLVIEDEMVVAMSIETLLNLSGCHIVKASTLSKAQTLIQTEAFDGALLDLNLRGHPAYPVATDLAERDIPFIFLTGYSTSHIEAPWRDRPVLEKPFNPERFERLIGETFTRRASQGR